MCDDLGYADVGFNGAKDIRTPHIDSLARAGTVFTSAYVPHPFCGPSRMGMLAGRYPHCFGAPFNLPNSGLAIEAYNQQGIDVNETLISSLLQESGYFTGAIGKWHLGIQPQFHPNARGFDEYYGFLGGGHKYFPEQFEPIYQRQKARGVKYVNEYSVPLEHNGKNVQEKDYITDALSREAVRFVELAAKKDHPFFLYLAYNAPHSPLEAKEDDLAEFTHVEDEKRRTYAAMVYAVDRGVGQLVEQLTDDNILDETLIVFLSDNGGKLGLGANNSPLREGKGSAFEGGFRVPMFFHWPGKVTGNRKFDHPISAIDFYPTFASLAGVDMPADKHIDGIDIWDAVANGENPRQGKPIFAARHRGGSTDVAIRRDQWKAVKAYNGRWQLFDVVKDISERHDVSGSNVQILSDLASCAKAWSSSHSQPRWFDNEKAEAAWKKAGMPKYDETFSVGK